MGHTLFSILWVDNTVSSPVYVCPYIYGYMQFMKF